MKKNNNKVDIFTRIEWSVRHHHYVKQQEKSQKKEEKIKASEMVNESKKDKKTNKKFIDPQNPTPEEEKAINDYCEKLSNRMKLSERFKKIKEMKKKSETNEEQKSSSEMTEEEKNQAACDFAVKNFAKNLEVAEAAAQ